jgi:hypothetical protein
LAPYGLRRLQRHFADDGNGNRGLRVRDGGDRQTNAVLNNFKVLPFQSRDKTVERIAYGDVKVPSGLSL